MDYQTTAGRGVTLEELENELAIVGLVLAGATRALETIMGDAYLTDALCSDLNLIKAAVERAVSRLDSITPGPAPRVWSMEN